MKKAWVALLVVVCGAFGHESCQADPLNLATNTTGHLPVDDSGRPLNLNFETGDLTDWTATGEAFKGQPVKGEIDQNRPAGKGRKSLHTGDYWIGGYELHRDRPRGTLTSAPFRVTSQWGSFLLGGGRDESTRVEILVENETDPYLSVSGRNAEEMRPVILDFRALEGRKIQIRIVDEGTGSWGHVNFDDFLLYKERPKFENPSIPPRSRVALTELYPYENLTGQEAASVMKVPAGFHVQLAAEEPDVSQPIAMAIDDRGRIWVAEAYVYPTRAEPGQGKDQILIFEDTNQDGVLDKRTVFIDGLNLVSGLEIGFGGVYVGAAPYLMFIPDSNGNDIPDGLEPGFDKAGIDNSHLQFPEDVPPGATVLLDGWAWEDTHETMNAFAWGPDGWLYGCHGVFTHSNVGKPGADDSERQRINAGIWRYHPVQHQFEIFAEGSSNPWGIDFDQYGQAFITACVIPHLYHVIPGARYQRQAGRHFNPHVFDDIKTIARHRHFVGNQWNNEDRRASDDAGGGHAHAGAMIYQGGVWPEKFVGKLFMHNIHGNRINVDQLIPEGSGYAGDRDDDFLLTGDKWSQMIALQYGPDGQAWMIDWYDQNQCHRRDEKVHDRSNGRIFRVSYGSTQNVSVDLQAASQSELVQHALFAKNEWYARHARRILQERASLNPINWESVAEIRNVQESDPVQTLRLMWLYASTGDTSPETLGRFLSHPHEYVRHWAVRLLTQSTPDDGASPVVVQQLLRLAAEDPSPVVRLAIASGLQRLPLAQRWEIAERLVEHGEDAQDHNLPIMYWYAIEPLADENPQRALALALAAGKSFPTLREFMIRRLGSGQPEEALKLMVQGLLQSSDDLVRLTFLKGMRGVLVGASNITPPDDWKEVYPQLISTDSTSLNFDVYVNALGLGARFGDEQAATRLRQLITDESGPVVERRVALSYLVENHDSQLPSVIASLLTGNSLRTEAIQAVATQDDAQLSSTLISSYQTLNARERSHVRNALASRPGYAAKMLEAVRNQQIPKSDLSADLVRQLRNLDDATVNELLEQVWGLVRASDRDRELEIRQLIRKLSDQNSPKGDPEHGRAVFARTCQQCHTLFGTGGKVGPDITGSNRANLEYLLSNILDPSSVMAKEYQPTVLATADGRILTGIIKEENSQTVTLQTTNELLTIPVDDIDARKLSDTSMMPDDLLRNMSLPEVRSLVAYLASPGQTALQAGPDNVNLFFSGNDLTNWRSSREVDENLWTVEDGELVGRSPGLQHNAFLMSELSLADFHFSCEVKLVDNVGNSGIQFRSLPLSNGEMKGYQADIGRGWWGKIYEESARGLLDNNEAEKLVKPGEWNRYEIFAIGSRIQTYINGQKAVDMNDPAGDRKGVIAFQLHSGKTPFEIRFRDLQLELIDSLPQYAKAGSRPGEWPASAGGKATSEIRWRKTVLDPLFRSEGVCMADFNNDGLMDVASGSVWYEQIRTQDGTIWKQHSILPEPEEFDPRQYSQSFMNFADDLNGDGWLDLIVVTFPSKATSWYENPGNPHLAQPGAWKVHEMIPVTNNESPQYLDFIGDGQRALISGVAGDVLAYSVPQSHPEAVWKINPVSMSGVGTAKMFAHGLGAGDINGDGRIDILTTEGWWEGPANLTVTDWLFHPAPLGEHCAHMLVYDFNGDGLADVLSTSAHKYGIWWHEQQRSDDGHISFQPHLIEKSISQTHAVVLADINGDGLPDFVTGKRWWAHAPPPEDSKWPGDPGVHDPAVIAWWEYSLENGEPKWTRHQIDDDSGVGTQFEVGDLNGDGLLDVVVSNKKGTFVLEQVRTSPDQK